MKYLPLIFSFITLTSCSIRSNNCKDTVKCFSYETVWPSLYGFTKEEIDTIILNTYEPDGSFSKKITHTLYDSTMLMVPNSAGQASQPWPVGTNAAGEPYFAPDIRLIVSGAAYDVEMIIPAAGKTYRITDVIYDGPETKEIEHPCYQTVQCTRKLVSYKLDGVSFTSADRIEIRK